MLDFGQFWLIFGSILGQFWHNFTVCETLCQVSRGCETIFESRLARDRARLYHTKINLFQKKNQNSLSNKSLFRYACALILYAIYRKNIIFLFKKVQKSILIFYVEFLLFVFHNVLWVGSNSSLSSFLQLPLLASTSGDILEVFLVKHSLVCNQLGRFSFSSKTFRPDDRSRKTLSPTGQGPGFGQLAVEVVRTK